MAGDSLTGGQRRQLLVGYMTGQWVRGLGLAAVVGLAYFIAADFSVRLLVEPEGVAVFWPAAGISSGILIVFGLRGGWPVLGGVVAATLTTHLIISDPLWAGVALGLCNAAEALVAAGLIHHYYVASFGLVRIRHVISLVTWLFPIFLWLAARCEPSFSAAGAFLVSMTIVWTTILGKGHFGDPSLPITDRVLGAQAGILVVAFSAYVLAALFAERRESARKLTQSHTMLERERDNKLMNIEAITAAIAHEVKQPLAAIVINGKAALRFLERSPPDHDEVQANLHSIVKDGFRTSEVFDGIRALFRKADHGPQLIDINEIILGTLRSLREELSDHRVETRTELTVGLPSVAGHKGQLQEVISNLIHNAVDAMDATTDRSRVLRVQTELRGDDAIKVIVEDSGPGIDTSKLDGIFGAFITTKAHGMGLGLAICRMIIEKHNGQITASSDGKYGALFQVVLPIRPPEDVTHA